MDMKSKAGSKGALMSGVKVALAVAGGILLAAFIQKQMAAKATEDAE